LSLDDWRSVKQTAVMRGRIYIATTLLLAATRAAATDEPPICADRPGKATSACTVPQGRWQLETGLADWTLQKADGERDTSLVLGETTIKYGLTDSSNIEIDITPWERSVSRAGGTHESASGFGDLDVIYKQRLTSSNSAVQVIAMPMIKLPTAKRALGNGKLEGGLLFPMSYSIPNSPLSLGATPELDWAADADGHGHHFAMQQVVTVGWAVNDKLTISPEIWGAWDWDPGGTTRQYSADVSLAYLVNKNLQLDAGANFGLNRETPDLELYTGVSVRF
jgi:hypothetical protein